MALAAYEAEMAEFDGEPPRHPSSFIKGKEASAVAMVYRACKMFALGAGEKNGAHGKASLFLKPIIKECFGLNSVPITPFRGHRFKKSSSASKMNSLNF